MSEQLLTKQQFMEKTGLNRPTLNYYIRTGKLDKAIHRLGRKVWIDFEAFKKITRGKP